MLNTVKPDGIEDVRVAEFSQVGCSGNWGEEAEVAKMLVSVALSRMGRKSKAFDKLCIGCVLASYRRVARLLFLCRTRSRAKALPDELVFVILEYSPSVVLLELLRKALDDAPLSMIAASLLARLAEQLPLLAPKPLFYAYAQSLAAASPLTKLSVLKIVTFLQEGAATLIRRYDSVLRKRLAHSPTVRCLLERHLQLLSADPILRDTIVVVLSSTFGARLCSPPGAGMLPLFSARIQP
ncbi:hypothetical protein DIPPA_04847 [Diplonema papillatum]|nr:hypothetical protein DIPPA_04847 [Diplonema papillatum]